MAQEFGGDEGDRIKMVQSGDGPGAHMVHADTRALYRYWEALRAERATPYRAEVDPRDMGCDPRDLFILEDLGRGNVRFRLAGTGLCERFGMEMRGMSIRSVMQLNARDQLSALIEEVLQEPGIGYLRLVARREGRPETRWEMLLLPLRSDFGQTDRLLGSLRQISGFPVTEADQPLRFAIEEMSLAPVSARDATNDGPMPLTGFGEPDAPFQHKRDSIAAEPAVTMESQLRTIEGGRTGTPGGTADDEDRKPARKPHLRLVKD